MTQLLQGPLHRAHLTLNSLGPRAVILDRDGIAWQKWYRRWWAAGYSDHYEDSLGEYELAQRGPVKVIHEGVKP